MKPRRASTVSSSLVLSDSVRCFENFWALGRCFVFFVDKHKCAFSLVEKCLVTSWPCPLILGIFRTDQNRWIFSALYSPLFIQFMKHLLTALFKNTQILKFKSQLGCRQIILADLLGNRSLLQRVQKVMVHLWFVIGRFRSVLCVSRFDFYDRNYNWRQRKTQLWR